MDDESFIGAFGDVPTDLAGDYSQLFIFRTEDFGAWCRRVRNAHEREVDGGIDTMTDAQLADRIDAEVADMQAFCDRLREAAESREDVTLWGTDYIALPVDADGVPIRVGDVMDKGAVTCISDRGKGWEVVLNNLYTYDTPSLHHHKTTVEDVLREFTDEVWNRCCEGATASDSGIDELVAECAAKLRLAEGVGE